MPRCCAVTQSLTENSATRCRMCSSTGQSLMASGRVPKTKSTLAWVTTPNDNRWQSDRPASRVRNGFGNTKNGEHIPLGKPWDRQRVSGKLRRKLMSVPGLRRISAHLSQNGYVPGEPTGIMEFMSSVPKKVMVTGSGGLIGSECARLLAREGWNVVGVDNDMRQ